MKKLLIALLFVSSSLFGNWNLYLEDFDHTVLTISDEVALYDGLAEDFFTAAAMKDRLDKNIKVTASSCILSDCFEDGSFALVPVTQIEKTNQKETTYEMNDDRSLSIGNLAYKAIVLP